MRNVWMIVSGIVIVLVGGGAYLLVTKQDMPIKSEEVLIPIPEPIPAATGNPLLSANKALLRQYYPPYCGADMYIDNPPNPHKVEVCINGIISRVAKATGVQLTVEDIQNSEVKEHWLKVMGVNNG